MRCGDACCTRRDGEDRKKDCEHMLSAQTYIFFLDGRDGVLRLRDISFSVFLCIVIRSESFENTNTVQEGVR